MDLSPLCTEQRQSLHIYCVWMFSHNPIGYDALQTLLNRISILGFRKCYTCIHCMAPFDWISYLYAPNMYTAVISIGCSILFVCWCTNQNMAFDVTGSWVFSLSLHIIQYVSHIELCLIPYWFTHPFMDGRRSLSAPLIDLKWKWFHIFITNPQETVALDSFSRFQHDSSGFSRKTSTT